jgi:hypothetical protein
MYCLYDDLKSLLKYFDAVTNVRQILKPILLKVLQKGK